MNSVTVREFDWGGCMLTDKRPRKEVEAFVGSRAQFMGEEGVIESIRLVSGEPPWTWDADLKPRPLYRVRWRRCESAALEQPE